jgi:hypothetical protein
VLEKGKPPEKVGRKVAGLNFAFVGYGGGTTGQKNPSLSDFSEPGKDPGRFDHPRLKII